MRLKVSWAFVSYWILGVENKIKKNIETNQNNNSEQLKSLRNIVLETWDFWMLYK